MSQNVHLYVIFVRVLGLEPHWMGPWKMTPRFLTFSTTSTIGSSTARPTAMPPAVPLPGRVRMRDADRHETHHRYRVPRSDRQLGRPGGAPACR